jgi:ATP-dependent Lon protease
MASALMRVPVRKDVAMTGEITLRGKVLPVGGIKDKMLAAHRAGVTTLIIPKENEKDVAEVPEEVRSALTFHFVETIDEVLALALEDACPTDAAAADVNAAQPPIWTTDPSAPAAPTMAE